MTTLDERARRAIKPCAKDFCACCEEDVTNARNLVVAVLNDVAEEVRGLDVKADGLELPYYVRLSDVLAILQKAGAKR